MLFLPHYIHRDLGIWLVLVPLYWLWKQQKTFHYLLFLWSAILATQQMQLLEKNAAIIIFLRGPDWLRGMLVSKWGISEKMKDLDLSLGASTIILSDCSFKNPIAHCWSWSEGAACTEAQHTLAKAFQFKTAIWWSCTYQLTSLDSLSWHWVCD